MSEKIIIQELAATTISFTATDTISDSGNGLGIFAVGDKLTITGSASNNVTVTVLTVAAGVITVSESTIVNESAGASVVIQSNLLSNWIHMEGMDNRTQKLPSIAGTGTFGGGTLKMQVSFEADRSNPFVYGTGLTADGVESLDIAGAKWARLNFSGASGPDLTAYLNF